MDYREIFKELKLNQTYFAGKLGVSRSRMTDMLRDNKFGKHDKKLRTYLHEHATKIFDYLYN